MSVSLSHFIRLTTSAMCVFRSIPARSRCERSPRPVSVEHVAHEQRLSLLTHELWRRLAVLPVAVRELRQLAVLPVAARERRLAALPVVARELRRLAAL